MRRPRVLIIDDETNFVSSLIYGLAAHGIEAHGAPDAAAGLAAAREHRPDTLLLDQRLPDGAGVDLIAPLHALDPTLRTPLERRDIVRTLRPTQAAPLSEQHTDVDASDDDTNKQADHDRLQQQWNQRVRPFDDDGVHTGRPLPRT